MISTNEFLKELEDKKYKVVETDEDRSGYFRIPLKNLNLGGEQLYISFNRVSEQFGAKGKLLFDSEDNFTQIFTKEDLESDYFKEQIGEYLQWAEEF